MIPRSVPGADLATIELPVAFVLTALGVATVLLEAPATYPLTYILTLPLVLFVPGYALMAVIYPPSLMGPLERFALSIAASVAVVPMMAFLLAGSTFGLTRNSILIAIGLFSFTLLAIALFLSEFPRDIRNSESPKDGDNASAPTHHVALSRIVVGVLILAIMLFPIFVFFNPAGAEHYTECYLLGPDGTIGSPLSSGNGSDVPVTLCIANREGVALDYNVMVLLINETNATRGIPTDPGSVDLQTRRLEDGAEARIPYMIGVNKRQFDIVVFLLFKGDEIPNDLSEQELIDRSYRSLYLRFPAPENEIDSLPAPVVV
jgi:uncharacterized membrane protein